MYFKFQKSKKSKTEKEASADEDENEQSSDDNTVSFHLLDIIFSIESFLALYFTM